MLVPNAPSRPPLGVSAPPERRSIAAPRPGRAAPLHALPVTGTPGPSTLADVWAALRRSADALGVPEHGVLTIARLQRRLRGIGERAAAMPERRIAVLESVTPPRAAGRWWPEIATIAHALDAPAWDAALALDAVFVVPPALDLAPSVALSEPFVRRLARKLPDAAWIACSGRALWIGGGENVALALEVVAEVLHPAAFRFGHEGRLWRRVRA